jgi:hypothetical protein
MTEKTEVGIVAEMPWHNGNGYAWGGDVIVSFGKKAINLGSSTLYNQHQEIRELANLIAAAPEMRDMLRKLLDEANVDCVSSARFPRTEIVDLIAKSEGRE